MTPTIDAPQGLQSCGRAARNASAQAAPSVTWRQPFTRGTERLPWVNAILPHEHPLQFPPV